MAEGYDVVGFDIEPHIYGEHRYPAQLVVQDVLTLHGSQFRDATLIVASPPCQEFSYMAMPWSKAKAKRDAILGDDTRTKITALTCLFDACFRIQREACAAAGHHIPLIVENVKGAQTWVGRARWNFGSFYLWGDIPALLPTGSPIKKSGQNWSKFRQTGEKSPQWNEGSGRKNGGDWFGAGEDCSPQRKHAHGSVARKQAAALVAKIPLRLSRHIAAIYHPTAVAL